MYRVDVLTLFPEVFAPFVGLSIVGRAVERGDDEPFGGGPGMVLRLDPIARVLDRLLAESPGAVVVAPAPTGKTFAQTDARRLASCPGLVLICGHYEGIDERLLELYAVEEYSLGDFVLSGGEIPALAFMDATVRLIDGVISPQSREEESFSGELLDYPAYTRPPVFRGVSVPEVLLSGDHAAIAAWRREQSRKRTELRKQRSS